MCRLVRVRVRSFVPSKRGCIGLLGFEFVRVFSCFQSKPSLGFEFVRVFDRDADVSAC
jgi:hypothetical protein